MAGFDLSFWTLLFKLVARQTGSISNVTFKPQKPEYTDLTPIAQPFPRATPESQGVDSAHIRHFLEALQAEPDTQIHHVIIARHGKIVTEMSVEPYKNGVWHVTHSMCKTITGMAVGLAIDEGLFTLDTTVEEIFPQYRGILNRLRPSPITVRDLLRMTSGVEFAESGAISGDHWIESFMNSSRKFAPGTKFDYNSMNSYMLSAIIQEKTGQTMFSYLGRKLFLPMGITEIYWERSPEGVTKGGWGLFIRPEDAVKLGQLYLNKGKWNGEQLISEEWCTEATKRQSDGGKYGYGYQCWMEDRPGSFAFNGLFGQNVICLPDLDMIVMCNAGNRELLASGALTDILRSYWGHTYTPSDEPLPENIFELRKLNTLIGQLDGSLPKPPEPPKSKWGLVPNQVEYIDRNYMIGQLDGHSFQMKDGKIGIFPLISQVMHNNFTDGIKEVGFEKEEDGTLDVLFTEGVAVHRVRVGFGHPLESTIRLHGEPWIVATSGRVATDENDRLCLVLNLTFTEEGMSRKITIYFDDEEIEMKASEQPGNAVAVDALEYTGGSEDLTKIPIVKRIVAAGGLDFVDANVQSTIHPIDYGTLITKDVPSESDTPVSSDETV